MWRLKIICTVLMACGPAGHLSKTALAVDLAGQFDAATTYRMLTTNPNVHEVNPLLRPFASNPSVFPALLATSAGVNWFAKRESRHGHPKIGRVIQFLAIADHVACGIHNLTMFNYKRQEEIWHLHQLP